MRRSITSLGLALVAAFASACAPKEEPTGEAKHAITGPIEAFTVVLEGPAAVSVIPEGVDARSPEAAIRTRARVREIEAEHAAIEPALEQHGAEVIARLSRLANAIEILADEAAAKRIAALPGVVRVERTPVVQRMLGSAVPLVGATKAWAGVPMLQGDGITIGIIDSGIDYTHADFGGPGTAAAYTANNSTIIEPGSFPTARVIGGFDLVGDAYNPSGSSPSPKPDADPLDCATADGNDFSGGHGTHVAGIAAGGGVLLDGTPFTGPYEASFDPSIFRVAPGVAPRANLYALRVFGCQGSTTMLNAALDRAADPNNDGAFDDRLDVVNLSLGSPYGLGSSTEHKLIANLAKVGTVVVAASGNEGQNYFVAAAPGVFPEVLAVGASVDNDLLSLEVTSPASALAQYPAVEAAFTKTLASTGPISAEVVAVSPALGCSAFTNAAAIAGKIAIVDRGTCPFATKLGNAAAAGAIAAIVIDNEDANLPFAMGGADPGTVQIPGFMVKMADGATIGSVLAQGKVTLAIDPSKRYTGTGAEVLAGLSSRGPSPVDGRLKPEISAPGADIWSAGAGTGADAIPLTGTSMACPMAAGAAALVRQAQPSFPPFAVKAALVNTGVPLKSYASIQYGTSVTGGGRMNVARAVATTITAAADPTTGDVGVSFGAVIADEPTSVQRTFVVQNHGASAVTLDATVVPTHTPPGAQVSVSPAAVQVAAGQSATLTLTLSLDPKTLGNPGPDPGVPAIQGMMNPSPRHFLNEASGVVQLSQAGGGSAVGLPYNGSVRAAVRKKGVAPSACGSMAGTGDAVEIALEGGGAHPAPVISAFQLAIQDEAKQDSDTNPAEALTDLRAVGIATDLATAASFDEAQVFFGVAVEGLWTTPARGPVSVVGIEINTNQIGAPEYRIRVEPRNPDAFFRDALVASTYNVATGERIARYPVNVLTPDVASTHPFHSSVLVLSARLSEIGITLESPVFGWTAFTESPDQLIPDEKLKGNFDVTKPLVDTARYGMNGAPMFLGGDSVKVHVSDEALAAGAPVDVLLLHHTNMPGERWEVVKVPVKAANANLAIAAAGPASVERGTDAKVTLVVTNDGADAATAVTVDANVMGGEVIAVETPQGSCTPGAALSCALGDLAAGAGVTVTATVRAAASASSIAVQANVASALECETKSDDNQAVTSLKVTTKPSQPSQPAKPPAKLPELEATGGCACQTGSSDAGYAGWLAAGLGLIAARRRRNRARR